MCGGCAVWVIFRHQTIQRHSNMNSVAILLLLLFLLPMMMMMMLLLFYSFKLLGLFCLFISPTFPFFHTRLCVGTLTCSRIVFSGGNFFIHQIKEYTRTHPMWTDEYSRWMNEICSWALGKPRRHMQEGQREIESRIRAREGWRANDWASEHEVKTNRHIDEHNKFCMSVINSPNSCYSRYMRADLFGT